MSSRKLVFVVALALALVFVIATAASARTLDGAISGLVLYPNGKPAAGVKVQVWAGFWSGVNSKEWAPFRSPVTTGRNGAYTIKVPPGTYRVWFVPADRETYCMEAYPDAPQVYAGDDVIVRAGRTTTRVSVMLDTDPGALAGTVYDASTGLPIQGIRVRLGFQAPAIINTEFGDAYSDAEGHYRFPGLKSWMWGAWAMDQRGVTPAYLDVLQFGWNWTPQAGTMTIDFDMEPEGFVSVRGTLVDGNTQLPISGAQIDAMLWENDGGYFTYGSAQTATDGTFEFVNLPAGQWEFWAMADGYNSQFYHGEQDYGEEIYLTRGHLTTLDTWSLWPSGP